jgi:FkbM family methyltransferase
MAEESLFHKIRTKATGLRSEKLQEIHDSVGGLHESARVAEELLPRINYMADVIHNLQAQIDRKVHNQGIISLSDKEIIAKIFSGQKMYLDPRDLAVVPHLALDGIWEDYVTKAWLRVVGKEDVIFDIGANTGYYAVIAGQITDKKKSRIIMFEANTDLVPYIEKTLSVNWLHEQCVIENLAIADKPGKVTLNVLEDYVGSSSIHSAEHIDSFMHGKMESKTGKQINVDAVTIDGYCSQHGITQANLMKIDIEGYEDKAYTGMHDLIANSPEMTLFLEFTKQSYEDSRKFFATMIEDFGNLYTINAADGNFELQSDASYDNVIESQENWVMLVLSKRDDLESLNE